jgi:branched-chain amino acid transport system substrate-binding protein
MLKGFLDVLGEKSSMVVAKSSYEVSEPTIDSHVVTLKSSGADVLVTFATPKFTVQTVKKVSEIGWKPLHIVRACRLQWARSSSQQDLRMPKGWSRLRT